MIRRDSAPGRDKIDYKIIKELPTDLHKELLRILNEFWIKTTLHPQWAEYQMFFIDKPGKEKVRSIALSSCMGKVFERIVNERLVWWAENRGILHQSQNGFRREKSCANNLTKITSDVRRIIYRDGYVLSAFLDVSAAYDNVLPYILIERLMKLGCPIQIVKYLEIWLRERRTQFIINNHKSDQYQ